MLVEYVKRSPGHRNSKGEPAPWTIVSHKTGRIISSHKTKKEAEEHLKRMHIFKEDVDMRRRKSRFLFEGFFDANSVSDGCGGYFWVKDGKVMLDRYNHENGRNEIPVEDLDDASDILLELLLSRKANYIKTSRNALLSGDAMRDEYLEFIPDRSIKFYTARGIAVSNLIAADLEQKLKDGGFEVIRSQDWYFDVVRHIAYIAGLYVFKPCAEFDELRNLLNKAHHHLKPQEWFVSDVTGKRGEIFDERKHYFCEDGNMCSEVLDFMRNNRGSIRDWSLEKFEDLDDMERGISYETEWSGHRGTHLVFDMKDGEDAVF